MLGCPWYVPELSLGCPWVFLGVPGVSRSPGAAQGLAVVLVFASCGRSGEGQGKRGMEVDLLGEGVNELEAQVGGTGIGMGLDTRGVEDVGEAEEARDGHGQGGGGRR